MKIPSHLYPLLILLAFMACETEIYPELEEPAEVVVIDAWLTNQTLPQNIYVTRSQPYFENRVPQKIEGANVYVLDSDSTLYTFVENDSAYTWVPAAGTTLGGPGRSYLLFVETEGQQYSAFATMGRVPDIDSIRFNFDKAIPNFIYEDYYMAEFFAIEPEGPGDTYWIKTWKNNRYLNKPSEINIAFDASGSAGASVDGVMFIEPIRVDFINPLDHGPAAGRTGFASPYQIGDSVYVEIHSISPVAFFFLYEVLIQTNRAGGFAALFAQPVANVSTNIFNLDSLSDDRPAGFFNVAAVSSRGTRLTRSAAEDARRRFQEGI